MAAIRIPIGMSDIIILFGSQNAANKAARRVLKDKRPIVTRPRKGFGE